MISCVDAHLMELYDCYSLLCPTSVHLHYCTTDMPHALKNSLILEMKEDFKKEECGGATDLAKRMVEALYHWTRIIVCLI